MCFYVPWIYESLPIPPLDGGKILIGEFKGDYQKTSVYQSSKHFVYIGFGVFLFVFCCSAPKRYSSFAV